jgi:hypothetical protein
MAGLLLLHRRRRPALSRHAHRSHRAGDPYPVPLPGGAALPAPADHRQSPGGGGLSRRLRLRLLLLLSQLRADRDLAAGLLHPARLHRRPAGVFPGDGAVASRPPDPVLGERGPDLLHPLGLPQPDRFLLAPGHDLLPGGDLQHDGAGDRRLRPLCPARADADRGVPAAGGGRRRLRCAERAGERHAAPGRAVPPHDSADRGPRLRLRRHGQRLGRGQHRRHRLLHHSADEALRHSAGLRRRGGDLGLDGRAHHAAADGASPAS